MNKKIANAMASAIVTVIGPVHAVLPTAEAISSRDTTTLEQVVATAVTDFGKATDDASSADDIAKKTEAVDDQLTSKGDPHKSPEPSPNWQDILLDNAGNEQEEKEKEADEATALGNHEEVSSGNITAPAPARNGEPAVTGEEQTRRDASADEEQRRAVAEAEHQQASTAAPDAEHQQASTAAPDAEHQQADTAAGADEESHEQAATEYEEQFGRPAKESEPVDETYVDDEIWVEDDADVNDPDID